MREICLDVETTGLDPRDGHKIIEIAAVELVNKSKTGNFFHSYINPRREVPIEAFKIHGISTEFLQDKPIFDHIIHKFLDFVKDSKLIIHNASFDTKFINYEMKNLGMNGLDMSNIIDSLLLARNKFPGAQNSLDALCRRFDIDLSQRTKHGALLDSELLADVYVELMGGAQTGFGFEKPKKEILSAKNDYKKPSSKKEEKRILPRRDFPLSESDLESHREFIFNNFKTNFWY